MVPTNQILLSPSSLPSPPPPPPPPPPRSHQTTPPPTTTPATITTTSSSLSLASTSSNASTKATSAASLVIHNNNLNLRPSDADICNFSSGENGLEKQHQHQQQDSCGSIKSYDLSPSYSYPSVPSVASLCNYGDSSSGGKDGPGKDHSGKTHTFYAKVHKGTTEPIKLSASKLNESLASHITLVSSQMSMANSSSSSSTLTSSIASCVSPSSTPFLQLSQISSTSPTSPTSSISSVSSPVGNPHIDSFSSSPAIINSDGNSLRQYSRSHQRRFHRRFPAIDPHEKLIDWYSCALVADILLQGYLYISENYFAFYSNILGYKTQLLIPICDVISVTKEKTAKIFPNAVGICTDQTKYVFGSLLSRESTFRLMQEVWKSTLIQVVSAPYFTPVIQFDKMIKRESDILVEKPEEDAEEEEEEDIEEAESAASLTEESMITNNQSSPLIFANIKSPLPETLKLVSSEIPSIQQILSSTHQETDSSGSDSEVNRESTTTSTIYQDSSTNLIHDNTANNNNNNNNNNNSNNRTQTITLTYGSRLMIKTKNWLITFIQPYQQLIWNQITDTTRLLLLTTTLLVMLFLSALIFLYRVEQVHSELLSLQRNTETNDFNQVQLKQLELRKEIKRLINLLEQKTMELSVLKDRIEEILNSYNHLFTCS